MKYLKERNHSSLSRVAWLTDRGQGDGALSLGSRNIDRARDTDDMKGKVYSAISRRMAEQAGEFEYIYMQVKREMQKVDSWKSRQTPSNFGFTLSLPAKDTLIHFTYISSMSPANDPLSDAASETRDVDTIDESTKEEPHADDRDRDRVHGGLEKVANVVRNNWEQNVSSPDGGKHDENRGIPIATRKAWLKGFHENLKKGRFEACFGGAFTNGLQPEIYLIEPDEKDSHPLFLGDGRQAYQMILTAVVRKSSRSGRDAETLERFTVNIVLPSTWLLSGDGDEWTISDDLCSSDGESAVEGSNWSVRLYLPASEDPTALVLALSENVQSTRHTLEQQDMPYSNEMGQLLSLLTDLVV
jgi:hypothetical protein